MQLAETDRNFSEAYEVSLQLAPLIMNMRSAFGCVVACCIAVDQSYRLHILTVVRPCGVTCSLFSMRSAVPLYHLGIR